MQILVYVINDTGEMKRQLNPSKHNFRKRKCRIMFCFVFIIIIQFSSIMKGLTLTFLYDVPNYEPCKNIM